MHLWPLKDLLSVTLVLLLTITVVWGKFLLLPVWFLVLLFCFLFWLSGAWGVPALQKPIHIQQLPHEHSSILVRVLWGIFFCAPVFLYLFLTRNQETPLFGDQLYHSDAAVASDTFWHAHWIPGVLICALVIVPLSLEKKWKVNICWIAVPFFCITAYLLGPHPLTDYAIRYPGIIYFLEIPFLELQHLWGSHNVLNAQRLFNALSVPVWLFVLRPLFVSRWPDLRLLPFVAFFFFQKDVVYYVTSGYIEPWPLIFVLLAIECLLVRRQEELWIACLLTAIAALMKDQFVFVLPLTILAGLPLRRLIRNPALLASGLVAAFSFLAYYLIRLVVMPHAREYHILAGLFGSVHLHKWWSVFLLQWQIAVPVLFFSWIILGISAVRKSNHRPQQLALLAMSIVLLCCFFMDFNEGISPAYPRYYILVWEVCGAGLLIAGYQWKKFQVIALSVLILILNSIPLAQEMVKAAEPDVARNYLEHTTCSVFFPLNALMQQAENKHLLEGIDSLRFLSDLHGWLRTTMKIQQIDFVYQYLYIWEKYKVSQDDDLETDLASLHQCTCEKAHEGVVFLPLFFANMMADSPIRSHTEDVTTRCVAKLKQSCSAYTELTFEGKTIGFLGIKQAPVQKSP